MAGSVSNYFVGWDEVVYYACYLFNKYESTHNIQPIRNSQTRDLCDKVLAFQWLEKAGNGCMVSVGFVIFHPMLAGEAESLASLFLC